MRAAYSVLICLTRKESARTRTGALLRPGDVVARVAVTGVLVSVAGGVVPRLDRGESGAMGRARALIQSFTIFDMPVIAVF